MVEVYINNIVEQILSQKFTGSKEEIAIKQILYLDNYIKENVDYSFRVVNYGIAYPEKDNIYIKDFDEISFFEERIAVCGNISSIAKKILNKLGIPTEYIYGHIGNFGHRWNIVKIGEKNYMIDFTASLIASKYYESGYEQSCIFMEPPKNEYEYMFSDKLLSNETIGGFKLGPNGHVDDRDEQGNLINTSTNLKEIFPNLETLEYSYLEELSQSTKQSYQR